MCSRIHYKMQKPNQGSEKKRGLSNCERFLHDRPGDSAWIPECRTKMGFYGETLFRLRTTIEHSGSGSF